MAEDKIQQKIEEMIRTDLSERGMIIPRQKFRTPDMGDLDKDQTSLSFLNKLEDTLDAKANGLDAAYFMEEPYTTKLGYHPEANIFCVTAQPTFKLKGHDYEVDYNQHDGDTVYFSFGSLNGGEEPFTIADKRYSNILEYMEINANSQEVSESRFGVRFAGVNSPEIPHFSPIPYDQIKDPNIPGKYNYELIRLGALRDGAEKGGVDGAYVKHLHMTDSDDTMIKCYKLYDKEHDRYTYQELVLDTAGNPQSVSVPISKWDGTKYVPDMQQMAMCTFEDATPPTGPNAENADRYYQEGKKAQMAVVEILRKAKDIIIILDAKTLSKHATELSNIYKEGAWEFASDLVTGLWKQSFQFQFSYLGFNSFGQEIHKRFLGCIYAKIDVGNGTTAWVNVTKRMLAASDEAEILKDYSNDPMNAQNFSFLADAFRLWTYNQIREGKYIDSLYEMSRADLDDRMKIQKSIMGRDWPEMKDWTVMVGDSLFMVPPTSIRCVTQTQNEKLPILRARGSMIKGAQKTVKSIEMTLYFNDEAINGVPYDTVLPNGSNTTYYINGLRSLIAQFKLTPFLPIENTYINEILGIEAVTLNNLQISTVPGYPRTLAATLVVEEFDYRIYMPEIPGPDPDKNEDLSKNIFAAAIHYETMRWHYQQSILRGEKISGLNVTDTDYLAQTFGGKTSLQPMHFGDSGIKFYVPNKEYLDKQLQLKLNAISMPLQIMMPDTEGSKQFQKDCAGAYDGLVSLFQDPELLKAFDTLQSDEDSGSSNYKYSLIAYGNSINKNAHSDKTITSTILRKADPAHQINHRLNDDKFFTEVNNVCRYIEDNIFKKVTNAQGYSIKEITTTPPNNKNVIEVNWQMKLNMNISLFGTKDNWRDFYSTNIEDKVLGLKAGDKGTGFTDDGGLLINIRAKFNVDGTVIDGHKFKLDTTSPAMEFLRQCGPSAIDENGFNAAADDATGLDQTVLKNTQDYMLSEKEKLDLLSAQSIKFDEYPIGEIKVKTVACILANTLSRITLQSSDTYAPQYMGGQDTIIEVELQTTDEAAVIQLKQLPQFAATYARDYRLVLNAWPLRIDSEITRMMSVNEVLIESVDVNTVPNQPGLFSIVMRLQSLDRSLKNRESMTKLDVPDNNGSIAASSTNTTQTKNYFDLANGLAKAEIYPDLELPTIDELASTGFKFIRYSNSAHNRVYPDPDFYFVYAHILNNEVLRNAVEEFFKDSPSIQSPTFTIEDMLGGAMEFTPTNKTAYAVTNWNQSAKDVGMNATSLKDQVELLSKQYSAGSKDDNKKISDYEEVVKANVMSEFTQSWDIAKNIMIHLREPKFKHLVADENPDDNPEVLNNKYVEQLKLASDEAIKAINEELSKGMFTENLAPREFVKGWHQSYDEKAWINASENHSVTGSDSSYLNHIKGGINDFINDFFADNAVGYKILQAIRINDDGIKYIRSYLPKMLLAAGAAKTSRNKYASGTNKIDWYPQMFSRTADAGFFATFGAMQSNGVFNGDDLFPKGTDGFPIPICQCSSRPGMYEDLHQAVNYHEALENGIELGMFNIKKYATTDALAAVLHQDNIIGGAELWMDPYYRAVATENERLMYKKTILTESYYATYAFMRNCLVMLKRLIEEGISISFFDFVQNITIEKTAPQIDAEANAYTYEDGTHNPIDTVMKQETANMATSYESKGYASDKEVDAMMEVTNSAEDQDAVMQRIYANEQADRDKTPESLAREYANLKDAAFQDLSKKVGLIVKGNNGGTSLGKITLPIIMALLEGDEYIYQALKACNYDVLMGTLSAVNATDNGGSPFQTTNGQLYFSKFLSALIPAKVVDSDTKIGTGGENASSYVRTLTNECVYLDEAEDPKYYILHSFYDMVMNDKRGRMARAFPTFYMLMIDEGREIGLWKLHDNFYTMSSISEIEVVKSRKIAADTAHITMSNMFKTYISDDDDQRIGYNDYSWKDVYTSIFSPRIYYVKEELRRQNANPAARAVIKPGIRIHLRAGYGADASQLPILFNGVMTEVQNGDVIDIIAQGDGVELVNPLVSDLDAEDVQYNDNFIISKMFQSWITHGATPRTILGSLLTTRGGFVKKSVYELTNGRFFNSNPYGIVHFGEPEYKAIFTDGEPLQNIYEGGGRPSWGTGSDPMYKILQEGVDRMNSEYATMIQKQSDPNNVPMSQLTEKLEMDGPPLLSTHIFGKSYWDIMHICRSACPDYIAAVAPFGLRSTVFFGAPRYYYAYDYDRDIDGTVIEKRKPFQQYHLYTSYSDIIGNGIIASEKDVRTCAVGTYTQNGWLASSGYKRTEPLWVSIDIYPEKQKTMTVDTQLIAKGSSTGDIIPFMNWINNELDGNKFNGNGELVGGHALAWRMTASALKDSVKDMYKGQLVIIGDPSVKPCDRIYISDLYERMQGNCEVEAVTHSITVEGGFTTTVNPDCIATIDDRHEQIVHHWTHSVFAKVLATQTILTTASALFGRKQRPLLQSLARMVGTSKAGEASIAEKIGALFGQDDVAANEKWIERITKVNNFFKIDAQQIRVQNYVNAINNAKKTFAIKEINTVDDLAEAAKTFSNAMEKTDPDLLLKELQSALDGGKLSKKDEDLVKGVIDKLKNTDYKGFDSALPNKDELGTIKELFDNVKGSQAVDAETKKMFEETAKSLEELISNNGVKNPEDLKKYSDVISKVSQLTKDEKKLEEITDGVKLTKQIITDGKKIEQATQLGVEMSTAVTEAVGASALTEVGEVAFAVTAGGFLPAIAFAAAEFAVVWAISSFVNEYVERWLKSLQVLQVFPMLHDGKPMTAGLDGAKGAVVGAPGYDDPGIIGGFLNKLLPDETGRSGVSAVWGAVSNFLLSDTAKNTIKNFKHTNGFANQAEDMDSSITIQTGVINELLQSVSSNEIKQMNDFRAMMLQPRVKSLSDKTDNDLKMAYNKYRVTDTTTFYKNPAVTDDMVCIETGQIITNMIGLGYMSILHRATAYDLPVGATRRAVDFTVQGRKLSSYVIEDSSKTPTIIDVPFIRADAYYLLLEIIERLDKTYNNDSNIKVGTKNWFEDHKVIVTSGLRIGDKTWSSTGYKFSMYVTNFDGLDKILSDIVKESQAILNGLNRAEYKFFTYENTGDNNYSIMVFPPKVGSV